MEPELIKSKSRGTFIFLIVTASLVVGGLYFYFNNSNTKETETKIDIDFDSLSSTAQLDFLRQKHPIDVLKLDNKVQIATSTLPITVLDLLGGFSIQSVWHTDYSTTTSVYEVDFNFNAKDAGETFHKFMDKVNRSIWTIVSASYSNKAALIDLDNETYSVSVDFSQIDSNNTSVKMTIIKNNFK